MAASVLSETIGSVRILTLNRPDKLNAADFDMQQRLVDELEATSADPDLRALVLTGAGRAFSAGGDRSILKAIAAGECSAREELGRIHVDTIRLLLNLSIPAIAAVPGPAVGYAAGLVALCDIVVMGEDGMLCDPHVRFGMPATTATQMIWPRLTSQAIARELLMSGREIRAAEAVQIGLANRLCPAGEERATALKIAETFVALPSAGVAATKRAFNQPLIEEFKLLENA